MGSLMYYFIECNAMYWAFPSHSLQLPNLEGLKLAGHMSRRRPGLLDTGTAWW